MSSIQSGSGSKKDPSQDLLKLLSSSPLTVPVSNSLIASNPAINLTATVGENINTIYVWRNDIADPDNGVSESSSDDRLVSKHTAGGTGVGFTHQQQQQQKVVQALRWKEDGQFLAAGWSDGVVRLMGLEKTGRSVHSIKVGEGSRIKMIGWGRNKIKRRGGGGGGGGGKRKIGEGEEGMEVEGLGRVGGGELAHELEFLEVEGALPKLSPLPVSGGSGDDMFLFSTTASLEFVFKPLKAGDADDVHVMVVGMEGGGIHLSIYDSFVIGTFRYEEPTQAGAGTVYELCGHSSRPEIATHMLLMKPKEGDGNSLRLVPMDLTFVHHSPVNLSLLASKVTTLQNLLRYVKQTQAHMAGEWKGTRELPSRFLLGVQDDLAKMSEGGNGELTIIQALYHTVVTGHVFPPVKEWLLEVVAERGHKRWEKAVLNGLLNLRSLVHENFIPALERCGVILSRLLGIARFHESSEIIGFKAAEISKLMDIVSCLMVVAHKVLLHVMTELEHFTAFSIWLRMEIDKQSSSSGPSDELTEKEATMDNAKVLTYIQRYLISSPLAMFFDEGAKEGFAQNEALAEGGKSLLQLLDKELRKQEAGQDYVKALPHVDFLVKYLDRKAGTVFQNIAEAEKRGVRFGQATEISIGEKILKHDVLLCAPGDSLGEAITAVVPERNRNIVYLFQTSVEITNGMSDTPFTLALGVRLPTGVTIIDLGFLSGKSLLALCHIEAERKYALVRIAADRIQYQAHTEGRPPRILDIDFQQPRDGPILEQLGFDQMSGFTPVQMEVLRGNDVRGEMPVRVCLMGRDRALYKTYKLPKEWDRDGSRESREGEEEEEEEE